MKSIKFDNNSIQLVDRAKDTENIKKVNKYIKKLEYIFDKLSSSFIYCIQRLDDDSTDNHNRIGFSTKFDEKSLFQKWNKFEYKELWETIYTGEARLSFDDNSYKPFENLLNASILFRLNFIKDAYELYLKMAIEAIERKDYTTYFVCRYNIHIAEKYLQMEWAKSGKEYIRNTERTQLENLYDDLKLIQAEKEVKELLNDILSKEYFENSFYEIERV